MEKFRKPLKIRDVTFTNRVVMAPMAPVTHFVNGAPMAAWNVEHYCRRAQTGPGLLIVQAMMVTPLFNSMGGTYLCREEDAIPLQRIAKVCHENGTKCFIQLHACPDFKYNENTGEFNALSSQFLDNIGDAFVSASRWCRNVGCDGVELHGAHGFFLNMLASPLSNRRNDIYGGDLQGRLRLACSVVRRIRAEADDNFLVGYRLGWAASEEEDAAAVALLEEAGVDLLHVSTGLPYDRWVERPRDFPFNQVVYIGSQIRRVASVPVIVVNDIRTLERGEWLLENDLCDFVAYGRPFLADARFWEKSLENPQYRPCRRCMPCMWYEDDSLCPGMRLAERQLKAV